MTSRHHQRNKQQQENSAVQFQSVLRVRPLLKKEREDVRVLEPVNATCVALHPVPPVPGQAAALISPSEQQQQHYHHHHQPTASATIETPSDVEFHFDKVLGDHTDQDKVYLATGMAKSMDAMVGLKSSKNRKISKRTHLILGIGLAGTGKTHTLLTGSSSILKRKTDTDGLVPRMLDSLFAQSKHNVDKKKNAFAVNLTVLQVNQSKSNAADCRLHDLLAPATAKRTISSGSNNSSGSSSNSNKAAMYAALDEPVRVTQDPVSAECQLINGQVRACTTIEEARESLQKALQHSRNKLSSKRMQSHVLVQMQPVLLDRKNDIVKQGGRIAVLDMAAWESSTMTKQRAGRFKDSAVPTQDDAHTAVLHCLRTLQQNEDTIANAHHDAWGKPVLNRNKSLKKVPFLQHKVTMLLQPLFSAYTTEKTVVTLILTVSPSHRDYAEKKLMLTELEALHRPPSTYDASTGLAVTDDNKKKKEKKERSTTIKAKKVVVATNMDDAGNVKKLRGFFETSKADVEKVPSVTYSDESVENEEPMPPPVAPQFYRASAKRVQHFPTTVPEDISLQASAPLEEPFEKEKEEPPKHGAPPPPPILTVDFPGVNIPCDQSELTNPTMMMPTTTANSYDTTLKTDNRSPKQPTYNPVMETFNKVAKKGRKVMEKMAVSHHQQQDSSTVLQKRVIQLEKKNAELLRENASLREHNKMLQRENDQLHGRTPGVDDDGANQSEFESHNQLKTEEEYSRGHEDTKAYEHSSLETSKRSRQQSSGSGAASSRSNTVAERNDTKSAWSESDYGRYEKKQVEERRNSVGDDKSYGDPLFKHMAWMNDPVADPNGTTASSSIRDLKASQKQNTSSFSARRKYSEEREATKKGRSSSEQHSLQKSHFDNPLFQHMAELSQSGRWNNLDRNLRLSSTDENTENNEPHQHTDYVKDRGSTRASYEDPVFQHLAHMNDMY